MKTQTHRCVDEQSPISLFRAAEPTLDRYCVTARKVQVSCRKTDVENTCVVPPCIRTSKCLGPRFEPWSESIPSTTPSGYPVRLFVHTRGRGGHNKRTVNWLARGDAVRGRPGSERRYWSRTTDLFQEVSGLIRVGRAVSAQCEFVDLALSADHPPIFALSRSHCHRSDHLPLSVVLKAALRMRLI